MSNSRGFLRLSTTAALSLMLLVSVPVVGRSGPTKTESATMQEAPRPVFRPRIRIWLQGNELRPRLIHAKAGRVLLGFENRTGSEATVQIDKVVEGGFEPLVTLTLPAQRKRFEREVTLAPGEYVLYETSRPQLQSRLTVAPGQ